MIYTCRNPLYVFCNANNNLDSAKLELRIYSGTASGSINSSWGSDPATYILEADSTDGFTVYFEVSELIKDYITLDFKDASNTYNGSTQDNANYQHGGEFRYPMKPLYAIVDFRFKRTVNGTEQGYFTGAQYGKIVTLGYRRYEDGLQSMSQNNSSQTFFYRNYYKRRLVEGTGNFPPSTSGVGIRETKEFYRDFAEIERPLLTAPRIVKPNYAPVVFCTSSSKAQKPSIFTAFKEGEVIQIQTVQGSNNKNGQLSVVFLGQYYSVGISTYTSTQDSVAGLAENYEGIQVNETYKYNHTGRDNFSPKFYKFLESSENNQNAIDEVWWTSDYNDNSKTLLKNTNIKILDVENRDTCGYEPVKVIFLNRFGVYEVLWYFKNTRESISLKSQQFKRNIIDIFPQSNDIRVPNYEIANHSNFILSKNATRTLVLNSDWYNEDMNPAFEDMMLSTHVWVQYKSQTYPVIVKDSKFTFRDRKTDGLINHQLTVDIAADLINNIT